jgi:VWFA-related protein
MRVSGVRRRVGSWPFFLRGLVSAAEILALAVIFTNQPFGRDPTQLAAEKPAPSPLVEREEVRFVALDLVVERHGPPGGSGWHLAPGLTQDQVHLLVGGQEISLDLFEDECPGSPPRQSTGVQAGATPGRGSVPVPEGAPPRALPDRKFVLYFDLEHLTLASRKLSFRAAIDWAAKEVKPTDEVMIVTGGLSLRIVRPLLAAGQDLQSDLRRAMQDFSSEDLWANGEDNRTEEIKHLARISRSAARGMANGYAGMDRDYTRRSLDNLNGLMTLFDKVEGTKSLIFMNETVRFVPGEEYPLATQLSDVSMELENLARAANERNVKIYAVQAGGLDKDVDDSMTMLTTETGGQHVQGTNRIGAVFARALEDSSCYYHLGFRVPSRHSGKSERITVRIGSEEGRYRVRYRRDLADPTREQVEEDAIRAAFLSPESARTFPVSVSAHRIYDHPTGSRFRIEVSIPLEALLASPGPPQEGRRMSLLLGGRVVPLAGATTTVAAGFSRATSAWINVDPRKPSWGFDRRAEIRVPPSAARRPVSRAVYRNEIDVPPGDYRIVSVVEDGLTRTISTALTDFTATASTSLLGQPVLGVEDPTVLLVQAAAPEAASPRHEKGMLKEIVSIDPSVPFSQNVPGEGDSIPWKSLVSYTPICAPPIPSGKKAPASERPQDTSAWRVLRKLACSSASASLPPLPVPAPSSATSGCLMMVQPLAGDSLRPGRCTLQVLLERPGFPTTETTLQFSVAAPPENGADPP